MFAAPVAAVCVLCRGDILKKGDKNLVKGRTEFSPKSEIVSLDPQLLEKIASKPYRCRQFRRSGRRS